MSAKDLAHNDDDDDDDNNDKNRCVNNFYLILMSVNFIELPMTVHSNFFFVLKNC